jgi:hypothetical protein
MEPGVLRSGSEQRDSVVEELDVDALRRQLLARSFPRLQMMLLLALAGFGAFVSSLAMLHGGITSMPARYFIAAALGYLIFLALVRAWLAYQRRRWVIDLADLPVDVPLGGGPDAPPLFTGQGGSFGGGGASGHFSLVDAPGAAPITPPAELPRASSALLDGIPDVDDAWPIVVVVFVALGALVALAFVVWASPALFAEVLLDAAVVGAVYRGCASGRAAIGCGACCGAPGSPRRLSAARLGGGMRTRGCRSGRPLGPGGGRGTQHGSLANSRYCRHVRRFWPRISPWIG